MNSVVGVELEQTLRAEVGKAIGGRPAERKVTQLKGDASNRSYFRVGTAPDSYVVMVLPPDAQKKSEEVSGAEPPRELPFINVQRYLQTLGVRVPRILSWNEAAGLMVLEDLGDVTFERALARGDAREALYGAAVDLLAVLRARAESRRDPECLAFTRSFDVELFDWELHHFREWGMEAWSGRRPGADERAELDSRFRKIALGLAGEPRGFTHRDFQSRNLMCVGEEMVLIDFQDALQGPRQYDLVALLRDSYVELDRAFVEAMLDRYLGRYQAESGQKLDRTEFGRVFDLQTVQRKLKDAGRFEFIHRVKGNPGFLVSIPASLRYVREAFDRLPELGPLRRIVAGYVPELA